MFKNCRYQIYVLLEKNKKHYNYQNLKTFISKYFASTDRYVRSRKNKKRKSS